MNRWTVAALVTGSFLVIGCSGPPSPLASGGVLDLRSVDFAQTPVVSLNGEWDFVSGDLTSPWSALKSRAPTTRTVPDLWKAGEAGGRDGHGAGTYHLTVLLPPHPPLALRYISAATAFRLEAGDETLVQVGVPSLTVEGSRPAYRPGTVRLPEATTLELSVRVSNQEYRVGGLWFPLDLGPAETIERQYLIAFSIAWGHSVALGVMALILIVLFLLRWQERAFLLSGLLALTLAIRVLVTGDYLLTRFWPSFPFDLMIRIEYLSVFACFPLATALFQALVPGFLARKWAWAAVGASSIFVLMAVVLPLDLLTRTISGFYVVAIGTIGLFLRSFWVHALKNRNHKAVLLLVGALVLALSIVNDVFYSAFLWKTANLGTWGFLFFILTLTWIDFTRLTSAISEVERLLVQKDLLIAEIHHRVRNNLQMVSSLVSLQTKRTQTPEAKEALATLKSRVLSMALVHEKLYGSTLTGTIDLGTYLPDLLLLMIPKEALDEGIIRLTVKTPSLELSPASCLDIGLVVTELVNNALKYSLLPRGGGELKVAMTAVGNELHLLVEDDGPGFPENFRPDESHSLGYKLITTLLHRYRGSWIILPGPGGRVEVRFGPEPA